MTGRRRRTAAAIALTAGITAGATLLLSACGPNDPAGASSAPSAAPSSAPTATTPAPTAPATTPATTAPATSAPATTAASGAQSTSGGTTAQAAGPVSGAADGSSSGHANSAAAKSGSHTNGSSSSWLNGTARGGLTISDGSQWVVMNGTRVNFGTAVRDLAWSRDGSRAAFIDGAGDVVTSNPDGSHRVIVVKAAGHVWSHPTWQVLATNYKTTGVEPKTDLIFAGRVGGVSRLYSAPASAHDTTAQVLSLKPYNGAGSTPVPQTGNIWPEAGGTLGTSVYANSGTGEVYVRDDNLRQQGGAVTTGSEPALFSTPNEDDIVFVRSVGGHDHLFVETMKSTGNTVRDLTPGATTNYTEPAWSPDGLTIAARTPQGIVTLPSNGSHAPVKVSDYHGLPAYRG